MYAKQQHFEYHNKPNKYLVEILVDSNSKPSIADVMVSKNGMEVQLIPDKLDLLSDYYNELYCSSASMQQTCRHCLANIQLPVITDEHKNSLERLI